MKRFANIAAFTEFLAGVKSALPAAKKAGLAAGANILADEMRSELGTYQHGDEGLEDWPDLSATTIADKERRGQDIPNPLIATRALQDSIGSTVGDDDTAAAGSTSKVAVWQDQGTSRRGIRYIKGATTEEGDGIPRREFVARAAFRKGKAAAEAVTLPVVKLFTDEIGGNQP
jgi:hypothetical protein